MHRSARRRGARRAAALGGIVGPTAFVGAWITGAAVTTRDYSAVHDAISRLAAIGNNSRSLMTAGFVGFGIGLPVYAVALRSAVGGKAWVAAVVTGAATLAVAALPLDRTAMIDTLHGLAAGVGYLSLAAIPLLAATSLARMDHRMLAGLGVVAGGVSTVSLLLTATSLPTGLFQRIGLTSTDVWVMLSAAAMVAGRLYNTEDLLR